MNWLREKIRQLNLLESIKYRVYIFPSKIRAFRDSVYIYLSDLYSYVFLKKSFIIDKEDKLFSEVVFLSKTS